MWWKVKATVLFMWPASWGTNISLFCCYSVNLFLIDYAWQELYNIWLLLFENNSRSLTIKDYHWRNNIVAVIVHDRVIDDNLKMQIKNQTLYSCRLFLLTWIFNILGITKKYFSFYAPCFVNMYSNKYQILLGN